MNQLKAAIDDLEEGARLAPLWVGVGWDQTMSRFRRTLLGPFWLSTGVLSLAFALTVVFGGIMGGATNWRENFQYVMLGILFWGVLGASLVEGSNAIIVGAGFAMTQRLPLSFHIAIHMYRILVNFFCQGITAVVLLILVGKGSIPNPMFFPAFAMVVLTTFFLSFILSIPSTRFRDVGYTVALVMQISFFAVPIFWYPSSTTGLRHLIVLYNPLAHELILLRQSFMGLPTSPVDWAWTFGTLVLAFLGTVALLWIYRRRVIFWL